MRRLLPVTDTTPGASGTGAGSGPADAAGSGDARSDTAGSAGAAGVRSGAVDREWTFDELAAAYAYPEPAGGEPRPWLRANMVSTLDGAAQHEGQTKPISSAADMRIFGMLRALADVVVVGAETVRQEGYRPARAVAEAAALREAAGQGPAPAIAVVSAGLELDFSLPLFTSPLVPTLLLTGAAADPGRVAEAERAGVRVVVAGDGMGVDPVRAVRALGERGRTRLLTEGGPRLLGQFVAGGVLDELCLTVAPVMVAGDAQRIAGGPGVTVPERFRLTSVLEEEGFLFTSYRRG